MRHAVLASVILALGVQCAPAYAQTAQSGGSGNATGGGEVRPKQSGGGASQGESGSGASGGASQGQSGSGASGGGASQGQSGSGASGSGEAQGQGSRSQSGSGEAQGGTTKNQSGSEGKAQNQKSEGESGKNTTQGERPKAESGKGENGKNTTQGEKSKGENGKNTTQGEKRTEPEKGGQDQNRKAETGGKAENGGKTNVNVQIRPEQRTKITQTVRSLGVRPVTDVGVRISVGTVIPKHVELRPLPQTLVEVVPEFRHYEFFVTSNDIVIVDPARLEIVDVIPL